MRVFTLVSIILLCALQLAAAPQPDDRAYDVRTHVVQPKETLYRISRQYGIAVAAIKKANKLTSDVISAAARLTIRVPKENDIFQVHIVRVSEDLEGISDKYLLPLDILTKYNEFDENVVFPGQRIFIKIDRINTKYSYKGEEDIPITDAEAGETVQEPVAETPTGTGPQPISTDEQSATPVYVFNPSQQQGKLTDSVTTNGKTFMIEGYLDAYYAQFSNRNKKGEMGDYAMSAPKHNQTGINTAQLAATYNDTGLRGNIILQYGDLPTAVYPNDFRFLQQANLGFKIAGKLWLDAGFFRSPVSVEDFPNRTNSSSIYTHTRFFEPVLYSGAKLGLEFDNLKIAAFVSDRHFSITNINANPAFGLTIKLYSGKHWLMGLNGMYTQIGVGSGKENRAYGNLFAASNHKHIDVLAYVNAGFKGNNQLVSGVLNVKYKAHPKFSLIARGEYFNDSSGTVSPIMAGNDGRASGLVAAAFSGGFEFKARPNHYLRIEARNTQLGTNYKIYTDYFNGAQPTNQRWEFVLTTGIWFGK